ncbi:MAG: ATP phosphoribosyltransferase [Planctomycetota bacterium]|nr:MAG: ATP phosphoribosyltransferase [Planctomycetota bacterium]
MSINHKDRIKIGIPSKGRLSDPVIQLLKRSGLKFRRSHRALYAHCKKNPITLVFVRADDIPLLVSEGAIDMGITGSDLVQENNAHVDQLLDVGFGDCRLCVAAPKNKIKNLKQLDGKKIVTSFPTITKKFFKKQGIKVTTFEVSGSVEVMIALGLADAIVDLVESGDTLRDNDLVVVKDIGNYETVLISNPQISKSKTALWLKKRIEGVVIADQYCLLEYNIQQKNLKKAESITPGFESPTVSPLEDSNWFAIKVMVNMTEIHEVMDKLEKIGATAIMQMTINNCRL